MSNQPVEHQHPVVDFAGRLELRLDCLAEVPVMSMSAQDKREALVALAKCRSQLEALQLRLLVEAEQSEATVDTGARSAADWLAVESRQVRKDVRSDLRLGQKLERHPVLSAAFGHGAVHVEQARAIVTSLGRLPKSGEYAVTAEQRAAAEAHLVALAADHDAKELRVLGRHLFEVVAPELAEKFEGRAVEAEEANALQRTSFTMWEDDESVCHGRFRVPSLQGQMLEKAILALTSPSRSAAGTTSGTAATMTGIDPDRPTPVRQGLAFTQLIETMSTEKLPKAGGCAATVVVTMTHEQLLADLEEAGVCTLDTGGKISASEARRLACLAGIIPMVLGGKSQVLDVGRKRRLHTEVMRIAMGVRDGGCTAEYCETPPGLCHAHHDIPWSEGGHTNLETGRLLCPHHHRRVHDPSYQTTRLPNGKVSFHRRE